MRKNERRTPAPDASHCSTHTTLTLYIYTPFMTDILVCAQQHIHLYIYVMCLLYKALYFS